VRRYLDEFLSDPRVVRLPRFLWLPILRGIVLRKRPHVTAEKYAAIWSPEGSPLAFHTAQQAKLLAAKTGRQVEYAMRYGEPSVSVILRKFREPPVVVPLYPQYSESTTQSVADLLPPGMAMVQHFFDHPGYVGALAAGVRRHWQANGRGRLLVMSFHGLPLYTVALRDPYSRQCRQTARLLAERLGLAAGEWEATFQSRFGRTAWIEPYTSATLSAYGRQGVGRVDVVCPGFVADCLETLEEIGIEARKTFVDSGGGELRLLPCLNERADWIDALAAIARQHLSGWLAPAQTP